MSAKTEFLNNLTDLLETHGISIRKFSKEVGINRNTIFWWFRGRSPKPQSLIKVADYFHCSIDYLLGKTDSPDFVPSSKTADFFTRFKQLRDEKQWSNNRIATLCELSTGTIANWKTETVPEFEVIVKLSELFGCSVDFLVGRSETK